jgi:hypothetical protein
MLNKMNEINIGGCYCGAIRYKTIGIPKYAGVCYCKDCRKIAGAQSVAWVTFPISDFEYTKGEPVSYQSSENVVRTFCGTCGTGLTYQIGKRKQEIDVTMASLDDPEKHPPRNLVYANEKLNWDLHLDLPKSS